MDNSNSNQTAKCKCGFWGSSSTHGLCSRCYKETIENSNITLGTDASHENSHQVISKPDLIRTVSSDLKGISNPTTNSVLSTPSSRHFPTITSNTNNGTCLATSSANLYQLPPHVISQLQLTPATCPVSTHLALDVNNSATPDNNDARDSVPKEHANAQTTNDNNSNSNTSESHQSDRAVNPNSSQKRGTKRRASDDTVSDSCTKQKEKQPPQKNKKRCFKCGSKLTIAQRSIGRCKCDYIFCTIHRMPEKHACKYDHKENGRQEAKRKMVKPRRNVGTSCKRIDSEHT